MEPTITVGIMNAHVLQVVFNGQYILESTGEAIEGPLTFSLSGDGKVEWRGEVYDTLEFSPVSLDATFDVADVTIGVNFHWERKETQRFTGAVKIIVERDGLTLINRLPIEEYLMSVISSEMSATADEEFLKAHAVISRSWLLAQILNRNKEVKEPSCTVSDDEIVRWYDREDHVNFDVCADDHCQRYQGITRRTTPTVLRAVEATRGLVLTDADGNVCDARFSKCCGGVLEEFENCWEDVPHSYLKARRDSDAEDNFPDLRDEDNARSWIAGRPEAYCNTSDPDILGRVLNNYDRETADFYRWEVNYRQDELAALVHRRSGIDFGGIVSLEPLSRGRSGRMTRLRITGTKRTMIIGKELEIRRTLSPSHLYSSAFIVEHGKTGADGLPEEFTLHGAGWGHGVGLCQIGAAVMSARGYAYDSILYHYFPGAELTTIY